MFGSKMNYCRGGVLAAVTVCVLATGCGPSTEEKMLAAMKRRRTPDDPPPVAAQPAAAPVRDVIAESNSDAAIQNLSDIETDVAQPQTIDILPIDQRRPAAPMSGAQRRRRAAKNITAIAEALGQFAKEKKYLPPSYDKTARGFDGVSWRVMILPYLGYDELYKKFDLTRAWDEEPNKSLMAYIPDEYVSPERFDTKTNYQVPLGSGYAFNGDKSVSLGLIEDGLASTLILVEVDDEHAVPWTAPGDWEFDRIEGPPGSIQHGIGNLRGNGTFAAWGHGRPFLLANSVARGDLVKAMVIDDGSRSIPGKIHRNLPVESDGDSTADISDGLAGGLDGSLDGGNGSSGRPTAKSVALASLTASAAGPMMLDSDRLPVPPSVEVMESKRRLKELYAEPLSKLKGPADHAELCRQLLTIASQMQSDPPGRYATAQMARRLAIRSEQSSLLIAAIDAVTTVFEVDPVSTNRQAIGQFVTQSGSSRRSRLYGDLLGRAVQLIHADIGANRYADAVTDTKLAMRLSGAQRDSTLGGLMSDLIRSLSGANRAYQQIKPRLATYRADPNDSAAATVVGKYMAFIRGDWNEGLQLLAEHDDGPLGRLSADDLAGGGDLKSQVELGDRWFDLAGSTKIDLMKNGCFDRANYWYAAAFPSLPPSLDRMHVEARLSESGSKSGSPVALLGQLARETNVDLTLPLGVAATAVQEDDD